MIYTPLTILAMNIAYNAHQGQYDRCGVPYVFHPYHVAEFMQTEAACCAALLHDVVEDTPVTLDDLTREGIPDEVVEAVGLLTHEDGVPYVDYVRRLSDNPIARAVKMSDLEHNSDITRGKISEERTARYRQAQNILLLKEQQAAARQSSEIF